MLKSSVRITGNRERIMFFTSEMYGGGAQRVILHIVNNIDRAIFQPILVLNHIAGPYISMIKPDVEVLGLGTDRLRFSFIGLSNYIRKLKPDILFSTLQGSNITLALAKTISLSRVPLIVRETNNYTAMGSSSKTLLHRLAGWSYRKADRVVCLSEGVKADVTQRYGDDIRVARIYNPIDLQATHAAILEQGKEPPWQPKEHRKEFEVLAVGSLTPQKGFDLLLPALATISEIPWKLTILGEGQDRNSLVSQAKRLGIGHRVSMPGFVNNPFVWMSQADLFVLSSRWEGFGQVIIEAMACGTPVLSTRCPSGPDEIITNGVDGRLCEPNSIEALATTIKEVALDPIGRSRYASNAMNTVQKFDVGVIVREYERLFLKVLRL